MSPACLRGRLRANCGFLLRLFDLRNEGVWQTRPAQAIGAMPSINVVLRGNQVRGVVNRLGYPAYFLIILGYGNFTGAIASHLAAGLIDVGTLIYLTAMLGITAASLALRPPS